VCQGGKTETEETKVNNELAIRTIHDVNKTAEIMVASGFFKDAKDVAKACVKILAGQELGVDPVAAMRGIDIVDGQITMRAHLMGGMIKRSGKYDYALIQQDDDVCKIEFLQGEKSLGTSTFTMEDARRANLANKNTWKQYPAAMLYNRAMSQGARMFCPDVFLGAVYHEGEIEARPEPKQVNTPEKPQNARKGLTAGWNADKQEMDVYQPVGGVMGDSEGREQTIDVGPSSRTSISDYSELPGPGYDESPDDDGMEQPGDIPEPMTPNQRGKLLGMLKQLGVLEGDKRELLARLALDKYGASALIDRIVSGGSDIFPWQILSNYIGLLRDRRGKANEAITDFCNSTYNERHPANLSRPQRDALIQWLSVPAEFSELEEEVIDEMAEWIEATGITSEQLSKMSQQDIAADIEMWKQLKAHQAEL